MIMEITQQDSRTDYHGMEADGLYAHPGGKNSIRLTSSELANLWASYMESSIKERMISYFLSIVEDPDIKDLLEYTMGLAKKHLRRLSDIYAREDHPVPRGFREDDVNPGAPPLFTDSFILFFLEELVRIRIDGYSTALQMAVRGDIRLYFTECLADSAELYNRVISVMLSRGICVRSPYIPVPERVDFAKRLSYFTGYLGKKRPLTSIEISHIFSGIQKNMVRKSLFTGFGQVAGSRRVREYMARGREISAKHVEIFSSVLIKSQLPVSMSWDGGVMKSEISPFSDRLIIQKISSSNVVLVGGYGKALSVVGIRRDLGLDFARLMLEVLRFTEDGIKILIENGWFEEPPQARGHEDRENRLH